MGKSMNPEMSGFRKWAEIHEPTKIDKARTGANEGGVIAAADVDQDRKTPEATTARPWLVLPGTDEGNALGTRRDVIAALRRSGRRVEPVERAPAPIAARDP